MTTLAQRELAEGKFKHPRGELLFRLFNTETCAQVSQEIMAGRTYPEVPFVGEVQSILDVGANIGAASVFFATTYPKATVYALEPGSLPFSVLKLNTEPLPNVRVFPFGLFSRDESLPLFAGVTDCVESSIHPTGRTGASSEMIALHSASGFLVQEGIARVDLLKIDTEGCEVPILQSLQAYLPAMKLIYVEYHSDRDRRLIDDLLSDTHVLWRGHSFLAHRGEFCYVRRDLLPPESETHTCEILLSLE